jgi:hypothetical protein
LYFDILELEIAEKNIQPEQTYNMDEKGFMIGRIGRQKRVFSRTSWGNKRFRQALEDGNREWGTIIACVSTSGVALPPGLIMASDSGNVQDAWVRDIKQSKHRVFVTVTQSGRSTTTLALDGCNRSLTKKQRPPHVEGGGYSSSTATAAM